jgi:hypothetical protein
MNKIETIQSYPNMKNGKTTSLQSLGSSILLCTRSKIDIILSSA